MRYQAKYRDGEEGRHLTIVLFRRCLEKRKLTKREFPIKISQTN